MSLVNLGMFAAWVLVGVLAALLARFVLERGGYGLRWDIVLGLVGSIAGSAIFLVLGISPGAGIVAVAVVAFVSAALLIVLQRKIWPAIA